MGMPLLALAFALLAQPVPAGRAVTLTLPHSLRAGDRVWLQVRVGDIGHGEITVAQPDGKRLGVISPYGFRAGQSAATYTIPVPVDAIAGDRLLLRLFFNQGGRPERAPTSKEVPSISVKMSSESR
jgi:hypothetical protein